MKFESSGIYPTEDLSVNNYPAILGSEFSERKIVINQITEDRKLNFLPCQSDYFTFTIFSIR